MHTIAKASLQADSLAKLDRKSMKVHDCQIMTVSHFWLVFYQRMYKGQERTFSDYIQTFYVFTLSLKGEQMEA